MLFLASGLLLMASALIAGKLFFEHFPSAPNWALAASLALWLAVLARTCGLVYPKSATRSPRSCRYWCCYLQCPRRRRCWCAGGSFRRAGTESGQEQARSVQRRRDRDHHHDHGARAEGAARRHLDALAPLVPVFLSYVLSFVYLGIYWNNHHHMLHAVHTGHRGDALGQPASAVLAVAGSVRHRLDGREPLRRAAVRRSTAAVLLAAAIAYWILQQTIIASQGPDSQLKTAIGSDWKGKLRLCCTRWESFPRSSGRGSGRPCM